LDQFQDETTVRPDTQPVLAQGINGDYDVAHAAMKDRRIPTQDPSPGEGVTRQKAEGLQARFDHQRKGESSGDLGYVEKE